MIGMSVLPSTRTLAWHEAHHAAALCLSGLPPVWARIDWPEERLGGSVRVDWEHHDPDPGTLREVLIATLMGPICDAESRLDDWPIRAYEWDVGNQRDAEQAAFLADVLGLDQVDWLGVVFKATTRSRERRFRELVVKIAGELERVEVVFQPELIRLAEGVSG